MTTRIYWQPFPGYPGINEIVWSSDSEFQLAKPLDDHLAELRSNGMANLVNGKDIPSPGLTEKMTYFPGACVSDSGELVTRPQTQVELDAETAAAERLANRESAQVKLAALGLTDAELTGLFS